MYLNCKTYFSYRYGTLGTEELVTLAAENEVNALEITNINIHAMYGILGIFARSK